jgi:hypothetical protein
MKRTIALLLAAGALVAGSAMAAPAATTKPKPLVLTVVVGKKGVAGGPKRFTIKKGRKVVLVVRSAIADEVHVHGYDLKKDVRAGGTVRIPFTAKIAGRFEVELENLGLPIAELTVK